MNDFVEQLESTRGNPSSQAQAASPVKSVASILPTHEQIAARAYDIYDKKGCKKGQCRQNWHQAERELRNLSQRAR